MKIGILGGSFNPPHIVHTMLGLYILETTECDRIFFIPTADHPLGKNIISFEHRLAMTRLAAAPLGNRAQVLDLEQTLPKPNYSINTIRCLKEKYSEDNFHLIVGSDILNEKNKWHRFDEIEREAPPIIVPRAGFEPAGTTAVLPDVQSSSIRERIAKGQLVEKLISREVLAYIQQNNLY